MPLHSLNKHLLSTSCVLVTRYTAVPALTVDKKKKKKIKRGRERGKKKGMGREKRKKGRKHRCVWKEGRREGGKEGGRENKGIGNQGSAEDGE